MFKIQLPKFKMLISLLIYTYILNSLPLLVEANEVLGCGGFIKSHVPIDFSKVEVKLVTKQGIVKDRTNCAPNNGYYFVPLYDKGELKLELSPPPGWSFTPKEINLNIDGEDPCSQGKDLNFVFEGFGIAGQVQSLGNLPGGPSGITVKLASKEGIRTSQTLDDGTFSFSPVFPGSYTVSVSHPRWKLYKDSITVQVTEGNTELPGNSLIVQGYDVQGKIVTADGSHVKNTQIALFSKDKGSKVLVDKCDKTKLAGIPFSDQFLCFVTSGSTGEFIFPVVPPGSYFVLPYYKEKNIHYQPEKIEFSVKHGSVTLGQNFKVIGFSISGRVTNGKSPIANAKVFLNGEEYAKTDKAGSYKLEKLKVGTYRLKAEADNLLFNELTLKIDSNLSFLPDLVPSAFKVCGKVISDKSQKVTFSQIGSTNLIETHTNELEEFCQYLAPGRYEISVEVNEEDRQTGLKFFPITQKIEVSHENIVNLVFSQLKSRISGKVECIQKKDCEGLSVILKTGLEELFIPIRDSVYSAVNIHPGLYEVALSKNDLCWDVTKQTVNVNAEKVQIPSFIQKGYLMQFISSHDTKISYKSLRDGKLIELNLNSGSTSVCLDSPGQYTFAIRGCHKFDSESLTYNTDAKSKQLTLNAQKHTVTVSIQAEKNYEPLEVEVQIGNDLTTEIVQFQNNKYEIKLLLKPLETAVLTPKSDKLFFTPQKVEIEGATDCVHQGDKFKAVLGKVFEGRVEPPLADVEITLENLSNNQVYSLQTDSKGSYKFPPMDSSFQYRISAKKDSYYLVGPDASGKFVAQKLAEISVEVLDEDDKSPLMGVLLSLSGGESYRRNLQTDSLGKITFHSLSASDYYLRPMMKEYKFEPSSKIINVKEGESIKVVLTGKRVAFSAFGKLASVNDEPVENVNIIASGVDNCTGLTEEATTDATGSFRIRGLQPFCSFRIQVEVASDPSSLVERTSPDFINIKNINEDVTNLHIIVFRPVLITDVLIKIYAEKVEHYRHLKLILYRESTNPSLIYSTSVEGSNVRVDKSSNFGILLHLPSLQLDNSEYSVHLEPGHGIKGRTQIEYFKANTSVKYIEMSFSQKIIVKEQPIKQTSLWTIVLILVLLLAAYNIQTIVALVRKHSNFNIDGLSSYIPIPSTTKSVSDYDNDIDQIVQDINNVRKNKHKKTN